MKIAVLVEISLIKRISPTIDDLDRGIKSHSLNANAWIFCDNVPYVSYPQSLIRARISNLYFRSVKRHKYSGRVKHLQVSFLVIFRREPCKEARLCRSVYLSKITSKQIVGIHDVFGTYFLAAVYKTIQ